MELYYQKTLANLTKLTQELSLVPGLAGLTHYAGQLTVAYSRDLSQPEQDQVAAIVSAHNHIDTPAAIASAVDAAMQFGRDLILQVATENMLRGVTTTQLSSLMTKTQDIVLLLMTGSLYTALERVEALEPDEFLTQDRINAFANRVRTYLGLPLI